MLGKLRQKIALTILPKADNQMITPLRAESYQLPNVPIYTDMSVYKSVREGYKISVFVYRAVRTIIQAASAVPWIVVDKNDEPIPGHPLELVLRNPNPEFSGQDLIEILIAHLELVGNALWQPIWVRNQIKEIWPVMPDLVQPIPSDIRGEWLKGWQITVNGRQETLPPEQFIHFQQVDPGNPYWGISPLMAAARTVDTDNEAQDTQKISMQNRGVVDGVFTHEAPLTQEQFEEARRQIREKFLDKSRRREPWVLGAGAKWNQMSLTPVEMDFIASRLANLRGIAAAYGLDPWWLGDRTTSTYNNVMEARKALYEDTVIPLLDDVEATINLKISPIYDGDIKATYDLSGIPAMREDFGKKVTQAQVLWGMGVPFEQINQRLEMGFEEFRGWDSGYLPLSLLPTGAPRAEEEEEMPKSLKSLDLESEEAKAAYWKLIDRRRVAYWGVVSKKMEALYRKESEAVIEAIDKLKSSKDMSPRDWQEAYAEGTPHWAEDKSPSLFAQEFAEEMKIRKLKSILEIGCGNGRDSIFFAHAGLTVTAIDVASGAIKLAKQNAKEAGVEIEFSVGNAEALEFADGQFNAVFSLSVLHSTQLHKSIPEVKRALSKNGIAFIYLYGDTQYADGHVDLIITSDDYIEMLKDQGFEILDFYSECEKEFDEFGEKHLLLVALLERA